MKEAETHGEEPMQEQVFWQELWPVRDPHWTSLFLRDYSPWKGSTLEKFMKHCSPWEGPYAGEGEQHEEEGEAEIKCYELTTTSISCPLWGEDVED